MPTTADLMVEVHSEIDPFRKGMQDTVAITQATSQRVTAELKKIEDGFGSIKSAVTSVQGAISAFSRFAAIGGGIALAIRAVSDTLERLKQIGEGADSIGVTTDSFQELSYAMSRAGVATDEQAEALRKFAEGAHTAADEEGELYDAVKRFNPEAADALATTKGFTGQLNVLAEAVKNAAGEQERAALITAAFGKNSDDLRRFLIGGASGIEVAAQKAREFGLVMDEELVRKAPEIQEQFRSVSAIIGVTFQNALISAAPIIVDVAGAIAELLKVVAPLADSFSRASAEMQAFFASADLAANSTTILSTKLRVVNADIEALKQEMANGGNFMGGVTGFGVDPETTRKQLENLTQTRDQIAAEIARRNQTPSVARTPVFDEPEDKKKSTSEAKRAQTELRRIEDDYLKSTKQVTDLARVEYDRRLKDLNDSLEKQLISAGDYTVARAQLEATLTAKLADEAAKQIKPITDAISSDLSRAFSDFIETGKLDFGDLARSMLQDIAKVSFQMAVLKPLFGGGTNQVGGGIIGNALAGVFHDGGIAGAGGATRSVSALAFAGAARFHDGGFPGLAPDEVPAILQRGERVLSRRETAQGGGSGGGTLVQVINNGSEPVRQERSRQGNVDVVRLFVGQVKDEMARGGFDDVLGGRFASKVQTLRR